jgi:hypothetical protein
MGRDFASESWHAKPGRKAEINRDARKLQGRSEESTARAWTSSSQQRNKHDSPLIRI